MGTINSTIVQNVSDRLAFQTKQIEDALVGINDTGSFDLLYTQITATGDSDVEIPVGDPYNKADLGWADETTIVRGALAHLAQAITGMEAHFARVGLTGGWDSYLTNEGIVVSKFFNDLFFAHKGQNLSTLNVFGNGDNKFGAFDVTAGLTYTFTDGLDYLNINSDDYNSIEEGAFGPTQLRILCVTTIGALDLDIDVIGLDEAFAAKTVNVTIPGTTAAGTFIDVGISSDLFTDVTDIAQNGAGIGQDGDQLEAYDKIFRAISL